MIMITHPQPIPITTILLVLLSSLSPTLISGRSLKGQVYAGMELCPAGPRVRMIGGASEGMPIQLSVAVGDNGQFVAELPDVLLNSVLKIEAECPAPTEVPTSVGPRVYSLNLATIDWNGARELLLFNDVTLLALGYPNH